MADPGSPFIGGPIPQHQDQGIPVPSYAQNYDFSPGFHNPQHSPQHYAFAPLLRQLPVSNGQRPTHAQHNQYQYPSPVSGFPAAFYMGNHGAMFQYAPLQALPPHNYQSESSTYPGFDEERNANETLSTQSMTRHPYPGIDLPNYAIPPGHPEHQWTQQPPQPFARRSNRPVPSVNPLPPDPWGVDAALDEVRDSENFRTNESYHGPTFSRTTSYERAFWREPQDSSSQEHRHSSRPVNSPAPLPDLGSSPRSSNRRSFSRYSTDLPNGTPESNGSTRSPASRAADRVARRQRPVSHSSFRRISVHMDHPNVPSAEQLQALRDKLRHFLPSELPEGTDAMCDICQKDYSTKHVDPSEDDEVAIQLPCKHVFGEHCINTWFETCKKLKNKITCPMCRKTLIEPRLRVTAQSPQQFFERLERLRREENGRHFFESLPRGSRDRFVSMVEARISGES